MWRAGLLLALAGCATGPDAALPEALQTLLLQGEEAEARGDSQGAGYIYAKAVRAHPQYSASWAYFGECRRFWHNDLENARDAFERALSAPRTDPVSLAFAWRGLGELAHKRGDIPAAIAALEKSVAIHPLADAHRSLSSLYATERNDFARAAAHAKAAVDASPEDPIALLQLAVHQVRAGETQAAERSFRKAIDLAGCDERGAAPGPVHCCVLYNGACYHAVRGDPNAALAMLEAFFKTPNHRHITREEILRDPDLRPLQKDSAFTALVNRFLR